MFPEEALATELSILIPTRDRIAELTRCLTSLRSAIEDASCVSVEVILGNDGDADDVLRFPVENFPCTLRVVQGPQRGPAANRNHLAECASGNLLVFLDDDVSISKRLVSEYAEAMRRHSEHGIFEGRISRESEPKYSFEEVIENGLGGYLWTANLAIRKEVFCSLGGFDPDFPFAAMEDTDFRYRASVAGIQVLWCPNAAVTHPVVVRKGVMHHAKHRYSLLLFLQKHPEQLDEIRQHFTLKQCLRTIKHFLVKRSLIQPIDGYINLCHRIGTILKTRAFLRRPKLIAQELSSLETELHIHSRRENLRSSLSQGRIT